MEHLLQDRAVTMLAGMAISLIRAYDAVEAERRGEKVKKKLAINEAEAAVVRRIFDLYRGIEGLQYGDKAIVSKLNAEGVTFRGKAFMISNVHRILTAQTYAGQHEFNVRNSKAGTIRPQADDELYRFR